MLSSNPARRPTSRQLLLPLDLPERPAPSPLPPNTIEVAPQQVWTTLAPQQQTQLRHTLLQIVQEVLRHADHR